MRIIDDDCRRRFKGPGVCEKCNRWHEARDPHHAFIKKGMGGGSQIDVPENLASLCRVCHSIVEDHEDAAGIVRVTVTLREFPPWQPLKVSPSDIREWLWAVVRAPKEGPMPPRPWELIHASGPLPLAGAAGERESLPPAKGRRRPGGGVEADSSVWTYLRGSP